MIRDVHLGLVHVNAFGEKAADLCKIVESIAAQQEAAEARGEAYDAVIRVAVFSTKPIRSGAHFAAALKDSPIWCVNSVDRNSYAGAAPGEGVNLAFDTQYAVVPSGQVPPTRAAEPLPAIRDFMMLGTMSLPTRLSVEGNVAEATMQCPSATGKPIKQITLVDGTGCHVPVYVCGVQAEDEDIRAEVRVLCFAVTAQEGAIGERGTLWLYDSGYVQVLQRGVGAPALRTAVVLPMKKAQ